MFIYNSSTLPSYLITTIIIIQLLSSIVRQQPQQEVAGSSSFMISIVAAQVSDSLSTQTDSTIMPLIDLEHSTNNKQQSSYGEQTYTERSENFSKSSPNSTSTEISVRGIEEYLNKDFLSTALSLEQQTSNSISQEPNENNNDEQQSNKYITTTTAANNYYNKKKLADYSNNGDWWNKLGGYNQDYYNRDSKKRNTIHKKQKEQHNKGVVYKEQPLNQNIILTLRNQLDAIKSKHRLLVTKSVSQLQQLDNKLISSYKLCFKKNMPLYGGMLYRTRDFVIRMAKDVKQERKVLESMTKQVQKVLKERIANKTLIKEYDRLTRKTNLRTEQTTTQSNIIDNQQEHSSTKLTLTRHKKDNLFTTEATKAQFLTDNQLEEDSSQQQEQQQIFPIKKPPSNIKKQKTSTPRYTIHVNEVNLKKELVKCQALIDRINMSTYELNSVADDIVYLFKLSDSPQGKKGISNKLFNNRRQLDGNGLSLGNNMYMMTAAEQRRAKKMLKSPIKVFLERYGKLTMGNMDNNANSAPFDSSNPPELKPIFDDPDLGFDENKTTTTSTTEIM